MSLTDDQKRLVLDWMRKLHTLEYAHRYASVTKARLNFLFGVPTVGGSALVATQVDTVLPDNALVRTAFGATGGAIAILAALLTFLKPAEVAEKHRSASAAFEALRHRLEFLITFRDLSVGDISEQLMHLKDDWDRLETPNVSTRTWIRAKARVTEVGTYPSSLTLADFSTSLHQGARRSSY